MTISVVIPARDAGRYLGEALDSVLGQTLPADEVVVVDDGSTDGTAEVAESYGDPVRCLRRQGRGIAAAVNAGIEASRGEVLAFLDADDLWLERKLELQRAALEETGADIALCNVEQFISPDLTPTERAELRPPPDGIAGFTRGAMMISRRDFERVGPFPLGWIVVEFIDWYGRAHDAGLTHTVVPEVLMRRRIHTTNTGRRNKRARDEYATAMRMVIERRRRAARES